MICLSNRIKMSKSDIYVPSCHIYVQITLYISKVQYICPKLRYVYPNPATCFRFIYNSQMILHISIQFRYKYSRTFSRYIYFMRSVSHVSLHDLSRISRASLQNSNMAAEERRIQRIVREIVSSEIGEPNLPTNVQTHNDFLTIVLYLAK